ncbi:hypothetical protein KSS87_005926, partial [Heliosperma pusillum]
ARSRTRQNGTTRSSTPSARSSKSKRKNLDRVNIKLDRATVKRKTSIE